MRSRHLALSNLNANMISLSTAIIKIGNYDTYQFYDFSVTMIMLSLLVVDNWFFVIYLKYIEWGSFENIHSNNLSNWIANNANRKPETVNNQLLINA